MIGKVDFTDFLRRNGGSKISRFPQCRMSQCSAEIAGILSHTLWQKFRESNFFLKKLLKSWFHEIFSLIDWERIYSSSTLLVHSVEITEIYSHTFLAKISWTQCFTKEVTKELIWQNIFLVRVNFSFFHTVYCSVEKWKIYSYQNYFSSNQPFSIFFIITVNSRNFCQK